jgi:predicted nucleotidyltransferase
VLFLPFGVIKLDLDQKRREYQHSLDTSLERIINKLSEIPEVMKVISFGSYANGKRDLFTDLDLIVIMETEKEFIQRTAELYQLLHSDVDLDLLVYTPEEFKKMRAGSFFTESITEWAGDL